MSTEAGAAGAIAAERAPYSLALDGAGRVLWISPCAERLLGRALGARRTLPEPIVGEARRLMQLASAQEWDPAKPLRFSVRARLDGGSALEAELWITRTAAGAPVVAVELDQVGPPRSVVAATAVRFDLTPSEADVLALVARGLSNMEIARALYVSIPTVKTHVHRFLAKLGVASRVQAVLLARKLG